MYAIYKYTLKLENMTAALVSFYNILLIEGYCVKRRHNLVDIILEKEKELVLQI